MVAGCKMTLRILVRRSKILVLLLRHENFMLIALSMNLLLIAHIDWLSDCAGLLNRAPFDSSDVCLMLNFSMHDLFQGIFIISICFHIAVSLASRLLWSIILAEADLAVYLILVLAENGWGWLMLCFLVGIHL